MERARRAAIAATLLSLAACGGSSRGGTTGAGGTNPSPVGAAGSGAGGGGAGSAGGAGEAGRDAGTAGASGGEGGAAGASAAGAAGTSASGRDGGPSDVDVGAGPDGDAAGAHLVLPVVRGTLDVLELGGITFAVNPSLGARITSFALDGDELLTGATANPQFWGSTLWTSPASDWVVPGTFVPPAAVDSAPYTTTVSATGVITATSAPSTANGKRFAITKVFHADLARAAIVIDYEIKNLGSTTFRLSHWEVTRVFPNGLTFFPSGAMTKLDFLSQPVKVQQAGGYTWYDNTTHLMGKGESKAGADSSGGFIAQVAPHAKGDLLFIKAFSGVTGAKAPPGHYPVELYCNDPHTYVELEDHSAYDEIAPGATSTRTVTWYVRRLPVGTDRSPGSPALIMAVLQALAKS